MSWLRRKKNHLALGVVLMFLTGCEAMCDSGIPTPHGGTGREGWWLTPPDSKAERYECFYWSLSDSTAIWCKPEPVQP